MSQIIEEKELKLQDFENTLSRFQEEEVDKEKLVDTIQSDKVAASRAMSQNKQLKKQLEELQEGFVQMVCSSRLMSVLALIRWEIASYLLL